MSAGRLWTSPHVAIGGFQSYTESRSLEIWTRLWRLSTRTGKGLQLKNLVLRDSLEKLRVVGLVQDPILSMNLSWKVFSQINPPPPRPPKNAFVLLILPGRREGKDVWHEFEFCVTENSIDVIINFHLVIFLFSFVSSLMWMMMSNNTSNYINFIWENIPFSWHFYFYKKGIKRWFMTTAFILCMRRKFF